MAGEKFQKWALADVSRRDMLAQDPYYGLSNSFQYSENINCDDELHGIKLSQRIMKKNKCANSLLVSAGNRIFAVPLSWGRIKYFDKNTNPNWEDNLDLNWFPGTEPAEAGWDTAWIAWTPGEAVIFQDYLWASWYTNTQSMFSRVNVGSAQALPVSHMIYDHIEDSDESISNISQLGVTTLNGAMGPWINQVLNFNNTRLVCWVGQDLRVYYPELDASNPDNTWLEHQQWDPNTQTMRAVEFGETGWKKVQHFEAWCEIVGLTCDFQYLKVWVRDEGWNTKMYYYPGNNDLRNTFVYNIVDMTGTKVLRTYNVNGIDYFTASLDWTDGYITFNKVIGDTPVQIFKQRGWLTKYDVNQKAWYFVGPTTWDTSYQDGNFYIGDAYWVFKFAYNPSGYDKGYLKRKIRNTKETAPGTVGLCIGWNFVYISDQEGIKAMRLYDTGIDGYEAKGILISREMEWDYGGCVAKIIDEIRCHFEMNNLKDDDWDYLINGGDLGTIDVYLSPNNTRQYSDPTMDDTGWWHVMTLDWTSRETRYEGMQKFSQLPKNSNGYTDPVFEFDRETITYCVVIRRWKTKAQWTPVVREIYLNYHTKGKTNEIYDIN